MHTHKRIFNIILAVKAKNIHFTDSLYLYYLGIKPVEENIQN